MASPHGRTGRGDRPIDPTRFVEAGGWLALLTDFGDRDGYVGILKAVIATIAPMAKTIDLTHQIPPQNLLAARFCLANAVAYLPAGTVVLAVVDPGVGGSRRPIAIDTGRVWLVGPDNGILGGVLAQEPAIAAVELTNPAYWRSASDLSTTFHGRDLFAPVAGHLVQGVPLAALGRAIDPVGLVQLAWPETQWQADGDRWICTGMIQHVDRFGNLITTFPSSLVSDRPTWVDRSDLSPPQSGRIEPVGPWSPWSIVAQDQIIRSGETYSSVGPGELVAIAASHGWLELACNGGRASDRLGLAWGDPVTIVWSPPSPRST